MKLINRKLGDGIHVKHGFAFLGEHFSDQGKYILLTPGNFYEEGGFKSRPEKDRYYIGIFPSDYLLKKDDLIVAMTEQVPGLLGSSAFIPKDNTYLHNQRLGLVDEIDKDFFDKKYLYHLFNSRGVRSQIYGSASGTKVRHTSPGRIYKVKILVPDVVKQKEISSIIENYNQLIRTNRRRIQLLEKSARFLFREWFVYFRFPGHEKVKIVDSVPDGWKKTTLGNVANRIKKNYSINDEDLNLVDLARINSRTLAVTDVGVASDLETARIIFEKDDILFSSIRPYLHKVVLAPFRGITNTSIFVIRAKNPIYRAYITLLLFSNYAIQFANQHSTGTKMPVVKWGSVSKLPALIPHQTIMEDFQNMVWPMLEQIQLAYFQNRKLAHARDLLLLRLMSGAIEVSESNIEISKEAET